MNPAPENGGRRFTPREVEVARKFLAAPPDVQRRVYEVLRENYIRTHGLGQDGARLIASEVGGRNSEAERASGSNHCRRTKGSEA